MADYVQLYVIVGENNFRIKGYFMNYLNAADAIKTYSKDTHGPLWVGDTEWVDEKKFKEMKESKMIMDATD